ncbi:hypothetical protein GGR50DRAFT_652768 [Xylaria sp. CBS 124048]|nr:hypothetical protein GGR50DRAFT_652768 [Xylaria sp. CBS 124048]
MLLPSALSSCDLSHQQTTRLQASPFASPPASPPTISSPTTLETIVNSCRALHSMMKAPAVPAQLDPLPTPPMDHAPFPPIRMRVRSRTPDTNSTQSQRLKIRKRSTMAPRGANKRRRAPEDYYYMDREDDDDEDGSDSDDLSFGGDAHGSERETVRRSRCAPSTPKRARIAPENLPRGLQRSDFHDIHEPTEEETSKEGTAVEKEANGEPWSIEDDRVLVELIFEKLKLSRTEWQECARRIGKSENGVERRWKTLIRNGNIGVNGRARRSKVHGTW